jgi:hypothetical protein
MWAALPVIDPRQLEVIGGQSPVVSKKNRALRKDLL